MPRWRLRRFAQFVELARNGNAQAEKIVREVVKEAADDAPVDDLCRIADKIVEIGEELYDAEDAELIEEVCQ